jgi:hypothetical protein
VYPGYVTEKICDVFKSNCVPIYWGHPDIIKDFNPSSFINANNFSNFDELVDYISLVDNSKEEYERIINAPIFSDNKIPTQFMPDTILKYFEDYILC